MLLSGLLSFLVFLLSFSLMSRAEGLPIGQSPLDSAPALQIQATPNVLNRFLWSKGHDVSNDFLISNISPGYLSSHNDVTRADAGGMIHDNPFPKDGVRCSGEAETTNERTNHVVPPQCSFWVGKQYIVGLRDGISVHDHLASLPASITDRVEQIIPEINGYAVSQSCSGVTLDLLRKDPNVGFIVTKPRGFFSADVGKDLTGDEKEDFEMQRLWSSLQFLDSEVEVTDDGAEKIPLSWKIEFLTNTDKEKHLQTVVKGLTGQYIGNRGYFVVFESHEQENKYMGKIHADQSVMVVKPQRREKGISYDVWDEEVQEWVTV